MIIRKAFWAAVSVVYFAVFIFPAVVLCVVGEVSLLLTRKIENGAVALDARRDAL